MGTGGHDAVPVVPVDQFLCAMSLRGAEIMWLLGAGASVAAGVPSADGLMWRLRCLLMATRRRLPSISSTRLIRSCSTR
jgi:hypothetical protein